MRAIIKLTATLPCRNRSLDQLIVETKAGLIGLDKSKLYVMVYVGNSFSPHFHMIYICATFKLNITIQ